MATRAVLSTALKVRKAVETDMLESPKGGAAIPVRSGRVGLEFRPFEIKTVRLAVVASGRRRSR